MSSLVTLTFDIPEIFPTRSYRKSWDTNIYYYKSIETDYASRDSWSKFRPPQASMGLGYNLKNVRLMFNNTSSTLPVNSKIIIYFDNWDIKEQDSVPVLGRTISQINHISPPISTIPFSYKPLYDTYVFVNRPFKVIFISDDTNKSIKNLQILIDVDQNDYKTPKSVEKIVNNSGALCFYDLNREANLFPFRQQDDMIYDDEICPSRSKLIDMLNKEIVEYKNKENICNQEIVECKNKENICNQQTVESKNKEDVYNQQIVESKNKEDVYNQQIDSLQQEISKQKVEYKNLDDGLNEMFEKERKKYYDILNNERDQLKKEKSDRNIEVMKLEMELEKERNHVEQIQDLLDSEKVKALTFTCPPTPICPILPSVYRGEIKILPIIVVGTIIITLIILASIFIYSKIKAIPMFYS